MFAMIFCRNDLYRPGHFAGGAQLLNALTPYRQADSSGVWNDEHALLAQALTWNTPESLHEVVPYRCPRSGQVIVSWVRLDNREKLASDLDVSHHSLQNITDPQLILRGYQRWGSDCVNKLEGDFAFAIYDPKAQHCFLARDSLGVKPLYYAVDENVLIVATTAAVFHELNNFSLQVDEGWMARYMLNLSPSYTDTAFVNVSKLPPAHHMLVTKTASSVQSYFHFSDSAPGTYRRNEQWLAAYRERLEEAVRCRLRSAYVLGSETSGGLDSSTVTAYAARFSELPSERLHTFGFATCELEPDYILETSAHYNLQHNHILDIHPDLDRSTLEHSLAIMGYPVEHPIATGHAPFYAQCMEHEIRTLFSGFGGDEVVTNQGHQLLMELLDARQYRTLLAEMRGNWITKPLRFAKYLQKSSRQNSINPRFINALKSRWKHILLRADILDQYDLETKYLALAKHDAPYRSINEFILQNRLGPFVPTRLDNCTLMAASHNIEYRWPLLDRRLIQQYLSTPSIEKYRAGVGRYLHRRAIEGVVPAKVQWKTSKDMGLPQQWQNDTPSAEKSVDLAQEIISAFHPAVEALIDREKLKAQVQQAKSGGHNPGFVITFKRQTHSLWQINSWLQRYFP